MAVLLNATQSFTRTTSPAGVPLTLACWATRAATGTAYGLVSAGNSADGTIYHRIEVTSGNAMRTGSNNASSQSSSTGIALSGTNTWFHAAGVFASTTSRIAYLNGTPDTASTTLRAPTNVDIAIGNRNAGGAALSGKIGEVAIWTAALNAAEIGALARGARPRKVRPNSLWGYWRLGLGSPEPDWSGAGRVLTVNGTPAAANPPPRARRYFSLGMLLEEIASGTTEILVPDGAVFATTNLSGAYTDIDELVASLDGSWLTAIDATLPTDIRVSFPTPSANLVTGAGLQKFSFVVRKSAGTPNPTINVELWENGSKVGSNLATNTSITSATSQTVEVTWDASALSGLAGTNVELRIISNPGIG